MALPDALAEFDPFMPDITRSENSRSNCSAALASLGGASGSNARRDRALRPVLRPVPGAGLPLAVVNPRQIRDFARATGRLAKTNTLDAAVIALFAERIQPEPRPLATEDAQVLAELVARRRQLIEMIGMEGDRRRQARATKVQRTLDATLKTLQAQLADLDGDIDAAVRASPAWRAADELLTFVPGVGDVTAPYPDCRAARAGTARPPPHCRPGRRRPAQPRLRPDARPPRHRRRAHQRAQHPVHGNPDRCALEPGHPRPLRPARGKWRPKKVALIACMRRLLGYPQCHHQDINPPWQTA